MEIEKNDDMSPKLEDYDQFCDSKPISVDSQKRSTNNDTLSRKRERDKNDQEDEEDNKDCENNKFLLYNPDDSDDDKDSLKDSNSSFDYEQQQFSYDNKSDNDPRDSDDRFHDEFYGELSCNDPIFQNNNE